MNTASSPSAGATPRRGSSASSSRRASCRPSVDVDFAARQLVVLSVGPFIDAIMSGQDQNGAEPPPELVDRVRAGRETLRARPRGLMARAETIHLLFTNRRPFRTRERRRVRSHPGLLRRGVGVRTSVLHVARGRRPDDGSVHAGLLPPSARSVHRADDAKAAPGDGEAPQGAVAAGAAIRTFRSSSSTAPTT